jgi:hypothetical protein
LHVIDKRLIRRLLCHAIAKPYIFVMGVGPTPDTVKQRRNMAHGIFMAAWKPHEGIEEI